MEGGLGPALGFGALSRNGSGSASLVKLGSQGPRPGPPHGSEPARAGGEGCAWHFCGGRWGPGDTGSGLWELDPRRGRDKGTGTDQAGPSQAGPKLCYPHRQQPRLDPMTIGWL